MTPEDRQKMMEEMQKKMQPIQEELKKSIESILLPNQVKRLKEIALQVAGTSALSDKQVQEELKLTGRPGGQDQDHQRGHGQKETDLFAEAAGDFQSIGPKMQELRQDTEKQLIGRAHRCSKGFAGKNEGPKTGYPRR